MAPLNIPLDALTSRLALNERFQSVRSQSLSNRFANLKPVGEFFDLKRLSKPRDMGDMQTRVNYNLSYFSSNYAVVFVMLSIYSLLTNLLLLFVIILVVGGMFGISKLQGADLDVGFARATSSQLYTVSWTDPLRRISPRKRFRDRSAALASPMGRPPGALRRDYDDLGRGHYYEDWELRDYDAAVGRRQASAGSGRLEELMDCEDEGVMLDAQGYYAWRDGRHARGPDELYYTGYDLGQDRPRRRMTYDYQQAHNGFDPSVDEAYGRRGTGQRISSREQVLADGALERIARARQKGKTNINLSVEEMEALERRRGGSQLPEPPPPIPASMPHPTPPTTPGKTPKSSSSKSGSRSNSSTNLASQKLKSKKTSLFGGSSSNQASSPSPAKSNSKAKVNRRPSTSDHHAGPPPSFPGGGNAGPPGIMVPGPDGKPMFAPLVNYPPLPNAGAEYSRGGGSRSSSKHSRRESTPPERLGGGAAGAGAAGYYYATNAGGRPESSGSNRSFSDMGPGAAGDFGWYPSPSSRQRSGSAAAHQYPYASPRPSTGSMPPQGYDDDYMGSPPMPAAHPSPHYTQRRPVPSHPSSSSTGYNVQYSPLPRRVPPSSSSSFTSGGGGGRRSMGTPGTSGLNYEVEPTSSGPSSDEDDQQGVQVNIAPEVAGPGAGYRVSGRGAGVSGAAAASPQVASSGGNQGRKRNKGGRR
ncbi:hypothetical protein D0865_14123 [Hortaea werneckii]|uniref:PRA1 family protein n=1 Tax=Hortaea werneckii TaxID=91943 RepID=A0A3M7B591_HORWE|nr:hypothetical protein D0865_14123 [Hortaea werneckii]